jgi:uncharacterized membrane protein YidH (DUF202 family)
MSASHEAVAVDEREFLANERESMANEREFLTSHRPTCAIERLARLSNGNSLTEAMPSD